MENKTQAQTAVTAMTNFVNPMNHDGKEFVQTMATEHRTLQQAFTKVALQWLEHVASSDYRTDGRNEASKEIAGKLLKTDDVEYLYGGKPSQFLPCI